MLKQNWTEVKKQLKHCSQNDLLGIIQELYKLNKVNKAHLHLRFLAANSSEQKKALLRDTIDEIHKQWNKACGAKILATLSNLEKYHRLILSLRELF